MRSMLVFMDGGATYLGGGGVGMRVESLQSFQLRRVQRGTVKRDNFELHEFMSKKLGGVMGKQNTNNLLILRK